MARSVGAPAQFEVAAAVGMDDAQLQAYEPAPGAHAYTAFMAWLALYGSEAEVAAGFLVNFAAWGANCGRGRCAQCARGRASRCRGRSGERGGSASWRQERVRS